MIHPIWIQLPSLSPLSICISLLHWKTCPLASPAFIHLFKVHIVKAMVFPRHVQMWELDHNECRVLKNWCFWIVVLGKAFESPLDNKEVKSVSPKGNQPWIVIGRTDAQAEALILWPPDVKSWLIRKDPDAGKDWGQEEEEATEDEMVGWRHRSTQGTWVWANSGRYWRTGKPGVLLVHGISKSWTWLSDWTTPPIVHRK